MDQARVLSAFFENILDSLLLTESSVITNEFDLEICFGSQALGMVADILS